MKKLGDILKKLSEASDKQKRFAEFVEEHSGMMEKDAKKGLKHSMIFIESDDYEFLHENYEELLKISRGKYHLHFHINEGLQGPYVVFDW